MTVIKAGVLCFILVSPSPFSFHSFNWDEPVFCTGQETGPRTGNGKAISSILFLFFGNWRTGFTGHTTSADERSGQLIMVSIVSKWIGGLAVTGRWDILFCPLWCEGLAGDRWPTWPMVITRYWVAAGRRFNRNERWYNWNRETFGWNCCQMTTWDIVKRGNLRNFCWFPEEINTVFNVFVVFDSLINKSLADYTSGLHDSSTKII